HTPWPRSGDPNVETTTEQVGGVSSVVASDLVHDAQTSLNGVRGTGSCLCPESRQISQGVVNYTAVIYTTNNSRLFSCSSSAYRNRPLNLDIRPQRISYGAVFGSRQLDRAQRLFLLDPLSADVKVERDVLVPKGNRVDALTNHVDLERLDRRALLRQDVDHVVRNARRQCAEQRLGRALSRLAFAIDAGRRSVRTTRIESVTTHPLNMDSGGF